MLALLFDLLASHLAELANRRDGDISIELLHRVVEDSPAGLILVVRLSLSLGRLYHLVLVYLEFFLLVEDASLAFLEDLVPLRDYSC